MKNTEQIVEERIAAQAACLAMARKEEMAVKALRANARAQERMTASVERGRRDEKARLEALRAKKYGCPCAQCRHS